MVSLTRHTPHTGRARLPFAPSLLLSILLSFTALAESSERPPNLLYITIDDLNDWIGCLDGHPQVKTPHMDRLAERGLLFTNAHCVVPACSGSRAANWSGLLPIHNGVYGNGQKLERTLPNAQVLPFDLREQGYYTMGTGKLLHGKSQRFFDEWGPDYNKWRPIQDEELQIPPASLADNKPYVRHEIPRLGITMPLNQMPRDRNPGSSVIDSFDWGPIDRPDSEWTDTQSADWAVEKLVQSYDKPFMLAVGFYRPHQPLWVPKRFHDMYPPESVVLPEVPEGDLDDVAQTAQDIGRFALTSGAHSTVVENGQWRNAVSAYLACITFVDEQLGKILDALDASEHADNTLVVLWSDHGWQLGEKEHWGKFTAWERSTRVPLIITPPANNAPEGFKPNEKSRRTVSLIDVYPTVIDMLGLEMRSDLDGRSLAPLVADPKTEWPHPAISTVGRGTHTVRHSRWRYTRYFDGTEELYDLRNDPNEWTNLINDPERAPVARRMAKHIPEDTNYSHFVRYQNFKAVAPSDGSPLMLFGPDVDMFAESKNVSEKYPQIVTHIQSYLDAHPNAPKHLNLNNM